MKLKRKGPVSVFDKTFALSLETQRALDAYETLCRCVDNSIEHMLDTMPIPQGVSGAEAASLLQNVERIRCELYRDVVTAALGSGIEEAKAQGQIAVLAADVGSR